MTDEVPEPIEGQLDVYETIEEVEKHKLRRRIAKATGVPEKYLMTPAQIVAHRLKEKTDGD